MLKRIALTLALFAVTCVVWTPAGQPAAQPFSADAYLAHVKYLASDELEGRKPGTPGIELAAEYIAARFKEAGLKPAGDNATYFQSFELTDGRKLADDAALLTVDELDQKWQVRTDWIPLPFTAGGDVEGPLAFAGFGIKARLHNYDDYEGFDAQGKVLLIFRYEPQAGDPEADFGGAEPSIYSQFDEKAEAAEYAGAKALLIVNPPNRPNVPAGLYPWRKEFARREFALPMAHISTDVAEAILKHAGQPDLATLQARLESERKSLSTDLNLTVRFKTGVRPNTFTTRNVLGLLEGDGTTTDVIVVGAHYDHLGKFPRHPGEEPQIHNGADDNASGTAGVIEMARVLGAEGGLRRSVLFIAFSAEEMGLLGSDHFVANPTIPLDRVRVMLNFDMIGRLKLDRLAIFGTPTAAAFESLVAQAAENAGVKYTAPTGMTYASDHAMFYDRNIPYLFPITGVHKEYHQPGDDWELIDAEGAARLLGMFRDIVRALANLDAGPEFRPHGKEAPPPDLDKKPAAEEQDAAPPSEAQGPPPGREFEMPKRPAAGLGLIPDHGDASGKAGMGVMTVLEGRAAHAAGMRDGDRILRIAGKNVRNVYDYMDALREAKVGETIEVVVDRAGKEIALKAKLEESRRRPEAPKD